MDDLSAAGLVAAKIKVITVDQGPHGKTEVEAVCFNRFAAILNGNDNHLYIVEIERGIAVMPAMLRFHTVEDVAQWIWLTDKIADAFLDELKRLPPNTTLPSAEAPYAMLMMAAATVCRVCGAAKIAMSGLGEGEFLDKDTFS